MSIYQKPVLILSQTEHNILDEQGKVVTTEIWWEGSFRGPNIPGLESLKDFFETCPVVEYTAGHANAGGVGIKNSNIETFLNFCNEALKDFDFTPKYKVDFIYKGQNLENAELDCYDLIDYNHLWGQELSQPLIAIEDLKIKPNSIQLMKGTTLKITSQSDLEFVKFRSSEQEFEILSPPDLGCVTIDVIGVCERNSYNDKPQIIIKAYQIKNRQDYYF